MGKRILVVDDFTTIQNFVRATLERKGYDTLGASNGNEAYRIISEASETTEGVDLVLTDYNMPRGTGYELLKKVKENPATAHIPVIFLTTELSYDKMKSAKEAGLFAWVKKPYRSEAFFEVIENALTESVKDLNINQ